MFHVTDDLRIRQLRPLISPAILMEDFSLSEAGSATVATAREQVARIVRGEDDRLLMVVGPCSIHDVEAAVDYGQRLKAAADRFADDLLILMRVYFEKPRTTVGWKGLINDPDLDGTFAINKGLRLARKLLLDLTELGVPVATEFLDTITPQFVADVISWGAIGARTTESQVHRELASGLSMPVGFKNGTGGSLQLAVDAVRAAGHPHHFLSVTKQGISAIVSTVGNDCCHIILRGSTSGPNYQPEHIARAERALEKAGQRARLMVDCSHGNSRKDPTRQPLVAHSLAEQVGAGSEVIMGVMVESHLVAGRQDYRPDQKLTYGQSITDACLAWEDTVPVLDELASAVRTRREHKAQSAA
jgi:3-deoxy-7-phosphoheptulonate synthase